MGILYRERRIVGLGKLTSFLTLVRLDGAEELSDSLHWDPFPAAVAAHGAPGFDQSYVPVPPLSQGELLEVDRLELRDTIESIQDAVAAHGVLGH